MKHKTIFTKMAEGLVKVPYVAETKNTFTILDQNPLTRGHCLVITKEQIDHIDDCSKELYSEIFEQVHMLSKKMRKNFNPVRVAIVVHGFEVPHTHVHVVPLYTGKEMNLAVKNRGKLDEDTVSDLIQMLML